MKRCESCCAHDPSSNQFTHQSPPSRCAPQRALLLLHHSTVRAQPHVLRTVFAQAGRKRCAQVSFTKIAPKEVKLRCGRCGKTRNVRSVRLPMTRKDVDLCAGCRRIFNERLTGLRAE